MVTSSGSSTRKHARCVDFADMRVTPAVTSGDKIVMHGPTLTMSAKCLSECGVSKSKVSKHEHNGGLILY